MALTRETAKRVMNVVESCGAGLFAELPALEVELTPDEFKRMKREIAWVIAVMDASISGKIAAVYPDRAPEAVPIAHKI
jgi:hypothetical protein